MNARRIAVAADLDYAIDDAAAVLLAVEAAANVEQAVERAALTINGADVPPRSPDAAPWRWVAAAGGALTVSYRADIALSHPPADLATLPATPLAYLPAAHAPYLFASRYCDPAPFELWLAERFGHRPGHVANGAELMQVATWLMQNISYSPVTGPATTAWNSLQLRAGVCRDFAHMVIASARALSVPARYAAGYAAGLQPPDFHAVAQVWLGGAWHLIDATGLCDTALFATVVTAPDAVEASFMTIFGSGELRSQSVSASLVPDTDQAGAAIA